MIKTLKKKLVGDANVLISMKSGIVTYVNPFSYLKLRGKIDINDFDYITSDGVVIKKLSNWFLKRPIQRLSPDFSSYFNAIFEQASKTGASVYFIGTMPGVIDKSIQNINDKFPSLSIVGYRDGYFNDDNEINSHIKEIININPDLIIVGMGTPLQETYLIQLKSQGWNGRGFTCGGFLHQTAHKLDYYPDWVNRFNLRWLYRIFNEPKLIKRYTIDYFWFLIVFFYDLISDFLKKD